MPKELERDLGLFAVVAISIGAMVGSGIFILPGLALKTAGPAVILAYLLAGVLVLPAALSKAEMATAMPEAGGTYIYIERGMGPLLGTIAGVGTWFSLSFKGALALVGGVPYVLYLFDLPVKPVALALAVVLVLVNLVGAKQTGRLQVAIVAVMLAAMVWWFVVGAPSTDSTYYGGFFDEGSGGLLAATGLVFVSYAGVTKIASVAEEVENPDRNIPLGILGSLCFTTLLYVLIVVVMVGVTPPDLLSDSAVPMIHAAEATLGRLGVIAIIIAAVLALISTANAGILSSSRYPFAMARDQLAPPSLTEIHDKWGTPVQAITLTGAVMLVLIAFVPILQIAKLASAFQIIVFALVNGAVIAFREGTSGSTTRASSRRSIRGPSSSGSPADSRSSGIWERSRSSVPSSSRRRQCCGISTTRAAASSARALPRTSSGGASVARPSNRRKRPSRRSTATRYSSRLPRRRASNVSKRWLNRRRCRPRERRQRHRRSVRRGGRSGAAPAGVGNAVTGGRRVRGADGAADRGVRRAGHLRRDRQPRHEAGDR